MFTLAGFVFLFIGIYMLAGGERSFSRQWKDLKARLDPVSVDVEKTGDAGTGKDA